MQDIYALFVFLITIIVYYVDMMYADRYSGFYKNMHKGISM